MVFTRFDGGFFPWVGLGLWVFLPSATASRCTKVRKTIESDQLMDNFDNGHWWRWAERGGGGGGVGGFP